MSSAVITTKKLKVLVVPSSNIINWKFGEGANIGYAGSLRITGA